VSGVLETREVDPGGEYFFGLGHFRRNMLGGGASIVLGPRLSLELRAATSAVRFQEESSFFDYDSRLASAGLGYELTPTLKTTLSYSYDTVPPPEQREQATAAAHNAQVTFSGDILPLMTGALTLGYRDQKSPNAAAGGTRYQGFTMGGSVTKQFSRESNLTLFVNRSTPVSAFEDNAFYVFTTVQGSARIPLPLEFQLRGGLGYQWNDYRTVAIEIGAPREDRVLGYDVGLRRAVLRQLFLSAAYRREERTSNIERFNTDSDGFIFQLEWDIFGSSP
jgi:opacity protein-like surface antigen